MLSLSAFAVAWWRVGNVGIAPMLQITAMTARSSVVSLGVLLIYTGIVKSVDLAAFAAALNGHERVSKKLVPFVTYAVPAMEVLVGVGALFGIAAARRVSLSALAVAATFTALCGYLLLLWMDPPTRAVPCGCGLSSSSISDWSGPFARASVLAAIAWTSTVAIFCLQRVSTEGRRHGHSRRPEP